MLDVKEGDDAQDVDIDCCTILKIEGLDANVADTNLESGQELILWSFISHLIY